MPRLSLYIIRSATIHVMDRKVLKGAVSRNSAKLGYCKMPVKLKET